MHTQDERSLAVFNFIHGRAYHDPTAHLPSNTSFQFPPAVAVLRQYGDSPTRRAGLVFNPLGLVALCGVLLYVVMLVVVYNI